MTHDTENSLFYRIQLSGAEHVLAAVEELGVSHVAAKVGRKNAAIAGSTRTPYSGRLAVLSVETTASWPSKAAVTESTDERSAVWTVTESGKFAEEDGCLTTVTLNFLDLTSALRTALPEIQRRVGKDHGCQFSQQRLRRVRLQPLFDYEQVRFV